jgi:dTDP-4-dehydrorhamnose reductase
VTGASGLLGGRLAQLLAQQADVVAARHHCPTPDTLASVPLDVATALSVETAIESSRPDAVIHAAALATAAECERDPELAHRVNVGGSAAIARACSIRGIRLLALSTDLVFAGNRAFSNEDETASPVMIYGRTKLLGEEAVLAASAQFVVVRVPLILGQGFGNRQSASESIACALRAGERPALFVDEFRTPVDPESLVPPLLALLHGTQTGRFHLGGLERVSRCELGWRVARAMGLTEEAIEPIRHSDRPTPTARPVDVSLDSGRAARELGYWPRILDDAIPDGRVI